MVGVISYDRSVAKTGVAREALLDEIVEHFVGAGVADFTLRSLASDLDTSHQLLMYHFGNREHLLRAALARIQGAVVEDLNDFLDGHPERRRPSKVWQHLSKPGPFRLRVQYECLGLALVDPDRYGDIAEEILRGWNEVATRLLAELGLPRRDREVAATLLVATMRGLGLDFIATSDRARIRKAVAQLDRWYDDLTAQ